MKLLYLPYKKIMRTVGLLIIGFIIGAVFAQIKQGQIIDELYIEKKELENHVVDLQNTIERLEDSRKEKQALVVRDIEIFLEYDDEVVALELKSKVSDLLNNIIGEDVESINPNLIRSIVHNRTFVIEENRYQCNLEMLIIAETTKVYTTAKLLEAKDPSE
ncbi:hypothetical protein PRVXT_002004 [Proteinivorax tanatarense]|uniref:Sporulation membrane protein YtrI C-terminal domain-containing protein n=1 Tax=Proteinivorax tanatarense TaxID=1260629 RepID=A0AAU7VJ32_9FIRM